MFPGISGQQGALTAGSYNIYLSSFAYGTGSSEPQPYITVNCSMLYNLSNTILTLQAYGYATSPGAKIIVNGGNNGGGSLSFCHDSTTTCTMTTSGAGLGLINRIATYNNTSPDLTAVNNSTSHSMINVSRY